MPNLTAKEMAEKEVKEELFEADKEEYKAKLKQLATAVNVVQNIRREIEDLDAKISEA
jgi:transcription termination factor NusB